MKIKFGEKIFPILNINIIKLELINDENNYDLKEQVVIPFGLFPNLKILHTNNKYILPCSMIINLTELNINYIYGKELLFLNDTDKNNINLNHLLNLKIINSKRNRNEIIRTDKNKYIDNNFYNIKFKLNKLEQLILDIEYDKDNSFLNNYFDLDILDEYKDNID